MSRQTRLKRTKDNAGSLVISLFVHTVALLCLYWMVTSTEAYQKLLLTATSLPASEDQPFVSVFPPQQAAEDDADEESLVQVDLLPPADQLASINSQSLLDQLVPTKTTVEFFGTQAYGNRFVYILDISMSMSSRYDDRIERAKEELIRSVSRLSPQQSYYVLSFCWQTCTMYRYVNRYSYKNRQASREKELEYVQATTENLDKLRNWLYKVNMGSGTDPRRALSLAHSIKPDAVFFLSDGDFNLPGHKIPDEGWINRRDIPTDATVVEGVKIALSDVPIHTIAYENPFTRAAMKEIAEVTGGSSRYVKTRSLEPLVPSSLIHGLREARNQRNRFPDEREHEHTARLRHAKTLIEDGELAFAEYLVRPTRDFEFQSAASRLLATEMFEILEAELGDVRLEDFPAVSLFDIQKKVRLKKHFPRFPTF